jgi:nuclear transport factor 2 (NTF2) superfamily protein
MRRRIASINDASIDASERRFLWPLGPRPAQHESLDDLGF